MEVIFKDYLISDDKSKIDIEVVVEYLTRSYWANKRSIEKIKKSVELSKCYGVYHEGKQIAFARIVTDWATIYYLCDVFVLEEYQSKGIGKKLVESIINSKELEWTTGLLGTKDAHELYKQYGFERNSETYMRRAPQARLKNV
ncbi:GNAT family N-acetyltransferase [Paenibacillus gallinarum]|uniref:GNAT family N-acetyltransferase n=1 Tax=Paenibacillus gallinarum TaxID=2762232 RepID=A0ABR8T0G8_9BACL|nr:GNAT family N-acetyltransferase [Paenibacillus gallinarum]MBD7969248.1 GNAT family N-acetyltransferase [Paenibacillus gallinarum]